MLVTLMCDASHCPTTKVAGYGFWIVCSRGNMPGDGVVHDVDTSLSAEMVAIASSIWHGLRDGPISPGDKVLIQVDCLGAIDRFEGIRDTLIVTDFQQEIIDYFWYVKKKYFLETEFRHVKAHTSERSARSNANRLCDRRARKAMRTARDELLLEQPCLSLS